jgi:hypothetical protein
MPDDVAGIIFFKIINVGTLYGILEKLLKKKHGATYSLFFNSFLKILRNEISAKRNEIVHWNVTHFVNEDGHELRLMPPNMWEYGPNSPPEITTEKLIEFIDKCVFFGRLCNMFTVVITPEMLANVDAASQRTWRDIFLQPVVYPPPLGHPLNPKPPAPEIQPPPSPV